MVFGTKRWSGQLTCSDREVAHNADRVLCGLKVDPSTLPAPSVAFDVRRNDRGYLLTVNGEIWSERPKLDLLMSDFQWAVIDTAFHSKPGTIAFHAGAVEFDGIRFLIPGVSEHGKSSLVLAACIDGALFGGDDLVWYDLRSRSLIPFPIAMAISGNGSDRVDDDLTERAFLSVLVERGEKMEYRCYFDPDDFGIGNMEEGPLSAIVLRSPPFDVEGRLKRLDPGEAMHRVLPNIQFIWDERVEVFNQMGRIVEDTPIFEAVGRKNELVYLMQQFASSGIETA